MHMTLYLPVAPFEGESGFHSIIVFLKSSLEVFQLHNLLRIDVFEPAIQALSLPLSEHRGKVLHDLKGLSDQRIRLAESREKRILPVESLLLGKGHPPRHLERCRRTPHLRVFFG